MIELKFYHYRRTAKMFCSPPVLCYTVSDNQ